jgi:hypothetical protein
MDRYHDSTIVTLGPTGTDSEFAAKKLSNKIILKESFNEAMGFAYEKDLYCLLSCGYIQIANGQICDTWSTIHFSFYNKMKIEYVFFCNTKPMSLATSKNNKTVIPNKLAIHPSTLPLIDTKKYRNVEFCFVDNKPNALNKVIEGKCDSCLCSTDNINESMHIHENYFPQMVWALYHRKN